MYYLVLQVCYYLMVGQVKSVKPVLKQLQQSIQTITAPDWPTDSDMARSKEADQFIWMAKEHLCVLVIIAAVEWSRRRETTFTIFLNWEFTILFKKHCSIPRLINKLYRQFSCTG